MWVEGDYKDMVVTKTGNDARIIAAIDKIWDRHSNSTDLELRSAYAMIEAVEILLGGSWKNFDVTTAAGEKMLFSQPFKNLLELARRADEYITSHSSVLAISGSDAEPSVDEMQATHPLMTPVGVLPDPNSLQYLGDPIWPWRVT